MKKKKKVNKKKLISRILILIILLAVIILFINFLFGSKKPENDKLALIVDNEDITESLISDIYIDKDGVLYLSTEDIKNIFDKNLYYEEASNKIITTYGTKVAAIDLKNNTIELNSATLLLSSGVIQYDIGYYVPISEITNVYNIEIFTTQNVGIISSLYKEFITATTSKKVSLKENPSIFSSTIQGLDKNEEVIYIGTAEKAGWIKVLTYEGNIGYIKENKIGEKIYNRKNMEESDFTANTANIDNSIEITKKTLTADNLNDFTSRKKVVEDIVSKAIAQEKYTINLNLKDVNIEEEKIERFVIELIPRLKEIGGNVLITNNDILSETFLNENNV